MDKATTTEQQQVPLIVKIRRRVENALRMAPEERVIEIAKMLGIKLKL